MEDTNSPLGDQLKEEEASTSTSVSTTSELTTKTTDTKSPSVRKPSLRKRKSTSDTKHKKDKISKIIPPQLKVSTDGHIDTSNLRKTNRTSRSCYPCYKRKVKCNFEIPCNVCIERNRAHLCSKEPTVVNGVIVNGSYDNTEYKYSKENEVLRTKIRELEQKLENLKKDKSQLESLNDLILKGSMEKEPESSIITENLKTKSATLSSVDSSNLPNPPSNSFSDGNNPEPWEGYSLTLDLLNKGIGVGLDDQNLNYNTVEWLRLGKLNVDSSLQQYLLVNSGSRESTIWNYWLEIIHLIGKRESDIMMKSALDSWFLHNIVDKEKVWERYDQYWAQELKDEKERHITAHYLKSKEEYLWMGQWYSLLCIGMLYSDESVQINLGFSMDQWEAFPRVFFSSALESMYRGGFQTYYRIEAIQLYCLLKLCAHALGGITLQNCLLSTNIYIARKLNLDKLTPEDEATDPDYDIKRRVWWYLVQADWNENKGRYSLVEIDSYSTPLPEIWKVKKKEIDWDEYYQRFAIHLGKIKKQYYYEDEVKQEELTFNNLAMANLELQALQKEVENDFNIYPDDMLLKMDPLYKKKVEFSQFIIKVMIAYEILEVNSKMSSFMSRDLWISRCHSTCVKYALFIITQYISTAVPTQYKMPWYIPNHAISAGVFLLVDHMLNKQNNANHLKTINLVKSVIPTLGLYRSVMRPAARGIYIIQKLIELLVKKDNIVELKKMSSPDVEKLTLKSRLFKSKTYRSRSFHGEGDEPDEETETQRPFKLNSSGIYTPPLTLSRNGKSNPSDDIASRGSTNNFILSHAPSLRIGTESPESLEFGNEYEGNSPRKPKKLEKSTPDKTNIYDERELDEFRVPGNTLPISSERDGSFQRTSYARSNFTPPILASDREPSQQQLLHQQVQHQHQQQQQQYMQIQQRHMQQQQQQQQQEQPHQQEQQQYQQQWQSESENEQPFYTRILDILGNTGWDEFLNSIDDFSMALDV